VVFGIGVSGPRRLDFGSSQVQAHLRAFCNELLGNRRFNVHRCLFSDFENSPRDVEHSPTQALLHFVRANGRFSEAGFGENDELLWSFINISDMSAWSEGDIDALDAVAEAHGGLVVGSALRTRIGRRYAFATRLRTTLAVGMSVSVAAATVTGSMLATVATGATSLVFGASCLACLSFLPGPTVLHCVAVCTVTLPVATCLLVQARCFTEFLHASEHNLFSDATSRLHGVQGMLQRSGASTANVFLTLLAVSMPLLAAQNQFVLQTAHAVHLSLVLGIVICIAVHGSMYAVLGPTTACKSTLRHVAVLLSTLGVSLGTFIALLLAGIIA
jgi:hypothetical protein